MSRQRLPLAILPRVPALLLLLIAAISPARLLANSAGPPNGRVNCTAGQAICGSATLCGTCVSCHTGTALNGGAGTIQVTGFPATYTPGQKYTLTITVSDPNRTSAATSRWGFEAAVMDATRCAVGTLAKVAGDPDTQAATVGGVAFLKQTSTGTHTGQTLSQTYTVEWTAPNPPGAAAEVYACGNAANNSLSSAGDRIYCLTDGAGVNPRPVSNPGAPVDTDGDTVPDASDNCPTIPNAGQANADGDATGDDCDTCTDTDGDGFGNPGFPVNTCAPDNCPAVGNPGQTDADGDTLGDACDTCTDTDRDGFGDPGFPASTCALDNCPAVSNPSQANLDGDSLGDACDPDADGDGEAATTDCDDLDPARSHAFAEICGDTIDNDCNSLIDAADPACAAGGPPEPLGLRVAKKVVGGAFDGTLIFRWDPAAGADHMNMYRGDLDQLPAYMHAIIGAGAGCRLPLPAPQEIAAQFPGAPQRAYYLCVAATAAGVESIYGRDSSGNLIPTANPICP